MKVIGITAKGTATKLANGLTEACGMLENSKKLFSMEQELAITETFTKENGMPAKGGAKEK
eukprot:scaffold2378_cov152-Skeletonema_menzelii.AAC.3